MKNKTTSPFLDELLLEAAKENAFFSSCGKVPKQWVPDWIRIPVKWLVLPFVLIDNAMQKLAKIIFRPPFKRKGACKRRGNCCQYVLITYSKSLIGRLFYLWYTQFLGFYKKVSKPHLYQGRKMHIMGCRHLRKDGTCGDYLLRPLICRQWPVIEHFGYPKVLKGCGYYSEPPFPANPCDPLSN